MKTFVVEYNNLVGRFDVESVFKLLFGNKEDLIVFSNFKSVKLIEIADLRRGPFGGLIKKNIFVEDGPDTYQVYEQYNAIKDDPKRARYFINQKDYERLKTFAVEKGDLIMSCSGTIGKITIIPDDFRRGVINQALLRIRVKDKNVNSEYFRIIFTYIIEKLLRGNELAYGSAIKNIASIQTLSDIEIPIPDIATQQKIVNIMQSAYEKKRELEKETIKLIDNQTAITQGLFNFDINQFRKQKEFVVNRDKLLNKRFDPEYYQVFYTDILNELFSSKIKFQPLKLIAKIFSGKTPTKENYKDEGYKIIKVHNLKNNLINWEKMNYFSDGLKSQTLVDGDILLLSSAHQSDYLGKNPCIVYIPDNLQNDSIHFVGELIAIRPEKVVPEYLLSILNSKVYYQLINREKRGQTSHIYPEDIGEIKIPVPDLSTQEAIAKRFTNIKLMIKNINLESKRVIEQAKQQVEQIILNG